MLHLERLRDLLPEAPLEGGAIGLRGWLERHPHEEAPLVAGVLVGVDDVEPGLGEEAADGGDQPRPVGAGEEQPRCRMDVFDRPIIPKKRRNSLQDKVQVWFRSLESCLSLWRLAR